MQDLLRKTEDAKGIIADAIGGFLQKKYTELQGQTITQMLSTVIRHSRHGDISAENHTTICRIETTLASRNKGLQGGEEKSEA